jgi:hypothetical protein
MSLFNILWEKHPTITGDDFPCSSNGNKNFENQCAIRMGECFERSGLSTKNLPVRRCWFHKDKLGHILSAEELAKAIEKYPLSSYIEKPIKFKGEDGFSKIFGKKVIIFFKDYYGPGNQGDHIDLWNGARLTRFSSYWDFFVMLGGRYRKAEVWFFWVVR